MSIKLKNVLIVCFVVSLLFELASFSAIVSVSSVFCLPNEDFADAQIFLMQSAKINNKLKRQINVYWHNLAFQNGDTIAIYVGRPNDNSKPIWTLQPTANRGFIGSDVYISLLHKYNLTSYKEEILVFCGAWLRDGGVRKVNCLSTHPTWMHDKKMILKNEKLSNLIIPGTSMSARYMTTLTPAESVADKLTVTQNQDILTQLVHGARYLDIAVGHYPDLNQTYWVVYNHKKIMPLERIIWDIRFFLNGTKEIVLLSFRDFFVGFESSADHSDFVEYLKQKFSDHLLATQNSYDPWSITTGEIWALDKRLLIIYQDAYQSQNEFLWPSPWTINLPGPVHLNNFEDIISTSETLIQHLFNFKENLTIDFLRIIYLTIPVNDDVEKIEANCNSTCINNYPSTSRILADKIAPIITKLYNEKLYPTSNILTANFLDATALVNIAELWNERKAQDCIESLTIWNQRFRGKYTRKTMRFS